MIKGKKAIVLATLAILMLTLSACDRRGKLRRARQEAEQAKAEMESTKIALERIRAERNALSAEAADMADKWEQTRLELAALQQSHSNLQSQVGSAVGDRNVMIGREANAQAAIENLRRELAEKTEEISELHEWIKELQVTISELQGQPQPEPEPPAPLPEPNAEQAPVADDNTAE